MTHDFLNLVPSMVKNLVCLVSIQKPGLDMGKSRNWEVGSRKGWPFRLPISDFPLPLIPWHGGIDLHRPLIDSALHILNLSKSLIAQPLGHLSAAAAVVTMHHDAPLAVRR